MSRIEDALAEANKLRQSKISIEKDPAFSAPHPAGTRIGKRSWYYGFAILMVLVVGFSMYRHTVQGPPPLQPMPTATGVSAISPPAVPQSAPARALPQNNRLPTCILISSPDAAYSLAHSGWQRFTTDSLDFRVLREHGQVKTFQVISRKENAITTVFFTTFLVETAGLDSLKVQFREELDGYYIERGTADNTVKVAIYRRKPAEEILAFVVTY
jgi:hypothetical protein